MTPKISNDYTAKIHKLSNGRITLEVNNNLKNTRIYRECKSESDAIRLLLLSGKQWVQVEEVKILKIRE